MPKLISGYIAAQFGKFLGPQVLDATLIRNTPGTRTSNNQTGGTNPTPVPYAAKGWVESYKASQIDGTLIKTDDRMIALLGATIEGAAVPEPGDQITIEGATYRIVGGDSGQGVRRDADGAVYRCHGRKP